MEIIKGSHIVKKYGEGAETSTALNGVNIEISSGEFIAVMGPSGSGKSTLLFALSGTDEIDSGSVRFDGKDLAELKENQLADIRRTKMGFVFQQPTMLKNLNLLDNIILPAVREKRKDTAGISKKAGRLMAKMGIGGLDRRDITEVSGGQLQRAGICRALMNEPDILFADEPTGALNSKAAGEVMDLLSGVNQAGTAILLVTHDAKVAARADRVLFMKDGEIASEQRFDRYTGGDNMESRVGKLIMQMSEIEI
jgi:putative ABC transport system ATP-binding protein